MIDSCQYSVPDKYVDRLLRCKVYTNKVLLFDNDEKVAEHDKIIGMNKWKIDISHYTYTLFRKPKALINSTAFKQMDDNLKQIYNDYFKNDEKNFILLLNCIGKYTFEKVTKAIRYLRDICPNNISIDKIEFICTKKEETMVIYLDDYNNDIMNKSLNMLNEFNDLL